jgi:hypothetical protein
MRIIALCKTFRGEEWLEPMILSIYPYVDKIVFVNSDLSWSGRRGNTCIDEIERVKNEMDSEDKIVSIHFNTLNQFEQCMQGYLYIKNNFKCDYVIHVDTDEIWDDVDLERAIDFLEKNPGHKAYRSNIYTYIKSPLWRVAPIEPLTPVVFTNITLSDLGKADRSCDLPYVVMHDGEGRILYHHYVYVRENFNTVLEKIITSHVSENVQYQPMDKWIPEVWNKFPKLSGEWLEGFHPNAEKRNGNYLYKRNWMGVAKITKKDMPRVLREGNFPILEQFGIINKGL